MRRHAAGFVLVGGCLLLMASGCAKQEMVRKDEGLAPAAASAPKPLAKEEAVREQPVKKETVSQSSLKESNAPLSSRASQLQAALQKIYFDFDSCKLSAAARATLVKNAEIIKKERADKVRIAGNCDERGSDEYNLALGEKRAKAAMEYLVTMGIPSERLSFISYGKEKPVDAGHNETAWTMNRRDDFTVVSK